MFQTPNIEVASIGFTALGVIVLWAKLGHEEIRIFVLSRILDELSWPKIPILFLELVIFLVIGVLVVIAMVKPTTAAQAVAAGMGWTGLLSQPNYSSPKQ